MKTIQSVTRVKVDFRDGYLKLNGVGRRKLIESIMLLNGWTAPNYVRGVLRGEYAISIKTKNSIAGMIKKLNEKYKRKN
jgi:hypothetical protein